MRIFVGIQLNDEMKRMLEATQQMIQAKAEKGSFTRKENFHLTLRFIGEVDEELATEVQTQLAEVKHPPFLLQTTGLDSFQKRSGFIPWVGLESNESLQILHQKVNATLTRIGIAADVQAYTPHLTLGRNVRIPKEEWIKIMEHPLPPVRQFVEEISLFQSHRIHNQLTYTPICTVKLKES